jgi:hypothetical protein
MKRNGRSVCQLYNSLKNNILSAAIGKTPNEALYGFPVNNTVDLLNPVLSKKFTYIPDCRLQVSDAIALGQISAKFHYDKSRKLFSLKSGMKFTSSCTRESVGISAGMRGPGGPVTLGPVNTSPPHERMSSPVNDTFAAFIT